MPDRFLYITVCMNAAPTGMLLLSQIKCFGQTRFHGTYVLPHAMRVGVVAERIGKPVWHLHFRGRRHFLRMPTLDVSRVFET